MPSVLLKRIFRNYFIMNYFNSMEFAVINPHGIAGITDRIPQHRIFRRRQFAEVRPDHVVKQMRLDSFDGLLAAVHRYGLIEILIENAIDQHRQSSNMIEMGMGQEYVPNRPDIGKLKVADAGACIKKDIIVDEHCGSA